MAKLIVSDLDLKGKKVLVRVDFNVPIKNGVIGDDNRIVAALPTIKYIIEHGGKAILLSHLGRVKSDADKKELSLRPVAERLSELLKKPVTFVPENVGIATAMKKAGKPAAAGFLLEKEIKFLGDAVENPVHPFVTILGGAKVSDKIGVIENLIPKSDHILIGGGMAYTFLAAQGHKIGKSLFEADKVELAKELLAKAGDKIVLPVDNVAATEFSNDAPHEVVGDDIPDNEMGLDIGPKTVEKFRDILKDAKTVVWNGPMGAFEMPNYAEGTLEVGRALADLKDAVTIIGGGDSTAAAKQLGIAPKISHISTGGGASLNYLEGKELPGIACVSDK